MSICFRYLDDDGKVGKITSVDVNSYFQEIAGPEFSAKDFRTWAGTVLAALALAEFDAFDNEAAAKRNVRKAIENVAARLGNTTAVCRKCYIHPEVLNCNMEGSLLDTIEKKIASELRTKLKKLRPEEAAVLALLHSRLKKIRRDRANMAKLADVGTTLRSSIERR